MTDLERRRSHIEEKTSRLLGVLRGLPAPDAERGREAAAIIEHGQAQRVSIAARDAALTYAVGGKGLFDWGWTPASLQLLEAAAAEVRSALRVLD